MELVFAVFVKLKMKTVVIVVELASVECVMELEMM
jgi:hypothetical protein